MGCLIFFMIIFDSNIWIAFLHKEDSQHLKAKQLFDCLAARIYIPEYVLIEILNVLKNKASNISLNRFIDLLKNFPAIEIIFSNEAFTMNLLDIVQENAIDGLSFVDQMLLYLSKDYQIYTFDEKLQKAIDILK